MWNDFGGAAPTERSVTPIGDPGAAGAAAGSGSGAGSGAGADTCDGQEVTVTGRWEASKNPKVSPPYKLMDASQAKACAAPNFFRGKSKPLKPTPAGWLE